jgi:serine/threonine-protein kinase
MILAIHFINSRGIFHRDLKPENFLINKKDDGMLYLNLNDFGIAKNLYSYNQSEISTTTGAFSGSI